MEDDTTFDGLTTAAQVEAKLATLTGSAAKCGGQKGTTSYFYIEGSEDFGFAGFENLEFSSLNSAALAIQEMANGKISFVVVDKTTATALVNNWNN
jgi:ABC-type amino acid transport substrate-binding protein